MAMITREQAKEAVHEVGRKYEQLGYAELERLVEQHGQFPPEEKREIEGVVVSFQPMLQVYGTFRKRIAVEVFIYPEHVEKSSGYSHYFEMLQSGEIKRIDKFDWQWALLLAFAAAGLVSIVWFVYDLVTGTTR